MKIYTLLSIILLLFASQTILQAVDPIEVGMQRELFVDHHVIGSKDIDPLFLGKPNAKTPHDRFFYLQGGRLAAVRAGDGKLFTKGEPYNLKNDLSEKKSIASDNPAINLKIEQLTSGTKHHFFGYIGQCRTIPWNAGGRYVLGLEVDRIDRLPTPDEAATVFVIDTHQDNKILRLDKTHAWNPQQGTMFYWHPLKAETQFFFNDRDVKTGKVFVVLYDLEKKKRVREYKYDDSPIGNGGVAADGSVFLGLNYGRLARLRLVTGYPEALDWSKDEPAPKNDGMFIVDIKTGQRRLLVSYRQLNEALKQRNPKTQHSGLFINHTLLNRKSDRVYFFVRGGWSGKKGDKINMPCSIHTDGSGLTLHDNILAGILSGPRTTC